jgi:diaminopimelate decarboxylase
VLILDLVLLAKKFGTPLYVLDEKKIREMCRLFKRLLCESYEQRALVLYAGKALSNVELLKIIKEEGLGLDVVSGGEIYTAALAGFPAEKIRFHGNNKSCYEIKTAIDYGVGGIVADNFEEIENLRGLCKKINVVVRVRPNVEVHTHDAIKTGMLDSKFGFTFAEAEVAVEKIVESDNLVFKGFHCHIGSQIFEPRPFVEVAGVMADFCALIFKKYGIESEELNLGGGFGIKYVESDLETDIAGIITKVSTEIKERFASHGIKRPFIYIEPGRSIVAEAGTTLYTVGSVKSVTNGKIYAIVDGSMADNPRFALYGSKYEVINLTGTGETIENITVAGKCCESGDIIAECKAMPMPSAGDILAVKCTGAYNYSMASNYNRLPRPAMVLVRENGKTELISRRQTYEQLIETEIFF